MQRSRVTAEPADWADTLPTSCRRSCSKPLTTGKVQVADVVITMGCGDACPIYPGKR